MTSTHHVLDHLVYLTSPGTLQGAIARFAAHGFDVKPGGTHADGLTANALVVLPSGTYIEIIHFTKTPDEAGPPGSPERTKREGHHWADKAPGWIDWALLDLPVEPAQKFYQEPNNGGRTREDGVKLKWTTAFPRSQYSRGALPFYCKDVTPRSLRVPLQNIPHSNGAEYFSRLIIGVPSSSLAEYAKIYASIVGTPHRQESEHQLSFQLGAPSDARGATLILEARDDLVTPTVQRVFFKTTDGKETELI